LVARAGGQDGNVAGLQREYSTFLAIEADPPLAARDAEDLMDPGMIVDVVVDAVAPQTRLRPNALSEAAGASELMFAIVVLCLVLGYIQGS
jgi:hypothetical protein